MALGFDYCFVQIIKNKPTNKQKPGTHPYGLGSGPLCGCPLTAHLEISETSPNIHTVRNMRLPKAIPDKSQLGWEAISLTPLPVLFASCFLLSPPRLRIGI